MTQPSPIAAPAPVVTAPPAAAPAAMPSLEARVAAVNEAMDAAFVASNPPAAGAAAPADALTASLDVEVPGAAPVPALSPEDIAAGLRATERKERLATLTAKTRDQVDRKAALAASDKLARDYEAAKLRADEAEKLAAGRVDVSKLDTAGLLGLAEKQGIKPDDLIRFISEAMTSPEKVAEAAALHATKTTYDPKFQALEKQIADQNARLAAYEKAQQDQQAAAQEHQQTQAFLGMVRDNSARAPIAARLLAADPQEFLDMANIAAARVPGMGAEALLDAVEELLDGDGRKLAQKYALLYGTTPSQPSAPVQPTTRGAAKPNTVSNSLTQSRTALVDDQDFARLTLEERAAILKRS